MIPESPRLGIMSGPGSVGNGKVQFRRQANVLNLVGSLVENEGTETDWWQREKRCVDRVGRYSGVGWLCYD